MTETPELYEGDQVTLDWIPPRTPGEYRPEFPEWSGIVTKVYPPDRASRVLVLEVAGREPKTRLMLRRWFDKALTTENGISAYRVRELYRGGEQVWPPAAA